MNFVISPIFPKCFLSCNLPLDHDYILEIIKEFDFGNTKHSVNNNQYNSFISKSLSIFDKLDDLKRPVTESLEYYIRNVLSYPNINFKIFKSWATMTPPGCHSYRHNHTNSWISGVYYPHDVCGGIVFHDPFPHHFQVDSPKESNIFNSTTWNLSPKKGDLIIFPSYLEHSVKTNTSEFNRYSVAFNVHPIGLYGEGDSQINVTIG